MTSFMEFMLVNCSGAIYLVGICALSPYLPFLLNISLSPFFPLCFSFFPLCFSLFSFLYLFPSLLSLLIFFFHLFPSFQFVIFLPVELFFSVHWTFCTVLLYFSLISIPTSVNFLFGLSYFLYFLLYLGSFSVLYFYIFLYLLSTFLLCAGFLSPSELSLVDAFSFTNITYFQPSASLVPAVYISFMSPNS